MKKKLTLLIALSIIIFAIFASTFTVASTPSTLTVEEPIVSEIVIESTPLNTIPEPPISSEEIVVLPPPEEEVVKEEVQEVTNVPKVSRDFKSYTNYKMLNRKSSQWLKVQTIAYTGEYGLRKVDDYYCVAMGSYYTRRVGDLFRITLETGYSFEVIITDFKSDRHTDKNHQYTKSNNCIVEFYVDYNTFDRKARSSGSISSIPQFAGMIVNIEPLGNYFDK